MINRKLVICCVVAAVASLNISKENLQDLEIRLEEIKNQLNEGGNENETRSERMKKIYSNIPLSNTRGVENSFLCGMCYVIVDNFLWMRRIEKLNDEFLESLAISICVDLEIQSEEVCNGIVEFNAPSLLYIVDNRSDLSADTACKLLLNDGDCINPYNDDNLEFTVELSERTTSNQSIKFTENSHNLTIIHITDIHFDPKYKPGAFADCEEYACCREIDDVNEFDPTSNAGLWGDYRSCDSSRNAILDTFYQIRKQHSKIDAIYFTGDIVNHFVWDASIVDMKDDIEEVYDMMREVFGSTPVYSILGNHDAQNIFAPVEIEEPSLSIKWLYEHVAELWSANLPPDALDSVKNGGYYTALIRPGLRLIALNNNVCFTLNWWIIFSVKSIAAQFQWMHDVLLSAENAGEKVHILAHIPNGDENFHHPCSREFQRVINRFHQTVAAQFNGHHEFFNFNIFYENGLEKKPVNIAWNGGSLATFSGVNRNYNLYNVDPVSFHVVDVESWIYNLTDANQHDSQPPIWFRQFSFREIFHLADLSPMTMNEFVTNLHENSSVVQQLWRMKIRDSNLLLKKGCDKFCLSETLCNILITDNNDLERCKNVKTEVKFK